MPRSTARPSTWRAEEPITRDTGSGGSGHWRAHRDRAGLGIPELAAGLERAMARGTTFHCLRHTFASEFMRQGGNIYQLQKILGHATILMTERYAHFAPEFLAGETESVSFVAPAGQVIPIGGACKALANGDS